MSTGTLLTPARHKQVSTAIARGRAWLIRQQLEDGGWHSGTYGGLRDGAAVTSLALYTLGGLPDSDKPEMVALAESAARFLETGFQKRRTIASPDGTLDYPTYAAALIVSAMRQIPSLAETLPRKRLLEYLLDAQATARRGFAEDSPEYGGWDLLGMEDATGISTGTNVSVTFYVLEALHDVDTPAAADARGLAKQWLLRSQRATGDGGFTFTADAMSHNNKAQWRDQERRRPRSYGSPTADGIQALLHCGLKEEDESVASAVRWLADHPAVEIVPGFEELPAELGWRDGLRFYYAQSLTRVLRLLPKAVAEERAERLAKWLLREQAEAGLWRNESARMREDDPLIATSLALAALARL